MCNIECEQGGNIECEQGGNIERKGVASTFEVVRPGSRSGLLWVCQEVGVVSFCCRLHVLFYF